MKSIINRFAFFFALFLALAGCSSEDSTNTPQNNLDTQNPVISSLVITQTDSDNDGDMDDLEGQLNATDNVGITSRKIEIRSNTGTLLASANPSQNGTFEILNFNEIGAFSGIGIVKDNAGNEATSTISFEVLPPLSEYELSISVELDSSVLIDGTEAGTVIGEVIATATADELPYTDGTVEFTVIDDLFEIDSSGQITLVEDLDVEDSLGFDIYTQVTIFVMAVLNDSEGVERATAEASDTEEVEDIDDFLNKYGIVIEIDGHQLKYNSAVNSAEALTILILGVELEVVNSSIADKSPLLGILEDTNTPGVFYLTFDINQNGVYYPISPLDMSRILFAMGEAKNPGDTQSTLDKIVNNIGDVAQMVADLVTSSLTSYEAVILSDGTTGLNMTDRDGGEIGAGVEYEAIRNQGGVPMN